VRFPALQIAHPLGVLQLLEQKGAQTHWKGERSLFALGLGKGQPF